MGNFNGKGYVQKQASFIFEMPDGTEKAYTSNAGREDSLREAIGIEGMKLKTNLSHVVMPMGLYKTEDMDELCDTIWFVEGSTPSMAIVVEEWKTGGLITEAEAELMLAEINQIEEKADAR